MSVLFVADNCRSDRTRIARCCYHRPTTGGGAGVDIENVVEALVAP